MPLNSNLTTFADAAQSSAMQMIIKAGRIRAEVTNLALPEEALNPSEGFSMPSMQQNGSHLTNRPPHAGDGLTLKIIKASFKQIEEQEKKTGQPVNPPKVW